MILIIKIKYIDQYQYINLLCLKIVEKLVRNILNLEQVLTIQCLSIILKKLRNDL